MRRHHDFSFPSLLFSTTVKNTTQQGTGSVSKVIWSIEDCRLFNLILPADNVTFDNCPTIKLCGSEKKHNARLQCKKQVLRSGVNQCVVM